MVTQSQIKRCTVCSSDYPLAFEGEHCADDGGRLEVAFADRMIGSLVGDRYQIESRIGAGSFSNVYLGNDKKLKRKVAIKLMHAFMQEGGELIKRFLRETEVSARLQHPNLAVIYDSGVLSNGQPYIAMEYLSGQTLESIIDAEKRLSVKRTVGIISQVCDALYYSHKQGVIHRDLTPRNIFVLEDDQVKLIDFGLARCIDYSQSVTAAGDIVGTPQFMSPEQCRGLPVDYRCDIYSVGLLMQYMLSGVKPVEGGTLFEVLAKHANEAPKLLSEICPELYFPSAITKAIEVCLAKEPADRFENCLELKEMILSGVEGSILSSRVTKNKPVQADGKASSGGKSGPIKLSLALTVLGIVAIASALGTTGVNIFHANKRASQSTARQTEGTPQSQSAVSQASSLPISSSGDDEKQVSDVSGAAGKPAEIQSVHNLGPIPPTKHDSSAANIHSTSSPEMSMMPVKTTASNTAPKPAAGLNGSLHPALDKPPNIVPLPSDNHQSGSDGSMQYGRAVKTALPSSKKPSPAKIQVVGRKPEYPTIARKSPSGKDGARAQQELQERIRESSKTADDAFVGQDFKVALMLYQQIERDLRNSGNVDSADMIMCKARIITCLEALGRSDKIEPILSRVFEILKPNMRKLINSIDCITWDELGTASQDVASGKLPNVTRADYLQWAEECFELAYKKWDGPKHNTYRNMIGRYCRVLQALGKSDQAKALARTEIPFSPEATQPAVASNAQNPKSPNPKPPGPKWAGHNSRYIRNYHF